MTGGNGESIRILVAEGNRRVREDLCRHLRSRGYMVAAAGSGEALLGLTREGGDYAVVLMDINCGRTGGVDVIAELNRTHPGMPVVVTDAEPSVESVVGSLRSGVFEYVIRPYEIQDLADVVTRAVGRFEAKKQEAAGMTAESVVVERPAGRQEGQARGGEPS